MAKIQVLSDVLASQVAAGEVVERPASVVKELVENSMDAGSSHIEVEILKGGSSLIKVTDDGCGMGKEDALMCLERHATSKLRSVDQLSAIATMGFRGEAMPSIASVSKFRLGTRERGAVEGTEVIIDGGIVKDVRALGMAEGSVIEVRNLFFNVPARRKFMRAETTESAHVEHQIRLHALAAPEIRFTYRKDGRVVFDLPGSKDRRVRIGGLAGKEASKSLLEIPRHEESGMSVFGFVLPSDFARKGRRQQFVFLNGRPIEDTAISRAMRDSFKGSLADGLNPAAWLWLEMDPSLVDVNVHPAKKEVRFHKPFEVRKLVTDAMEQAAEERNQPSSLRGLPKVVSRMNGNTTAVSYVPSEKNSSVKHLDSDSPVKSREIEAIEASSKTVSELSEEGSEDISQPVNLEEKSQQIQSEPNIIRPELSSVREVQQELQAPSEVDSVETPNLSVIGALHDRYFLLEGEEGLVMLDPQAASERITYEVFMRASETGNIESQGLLVPELIELDAHDLDVVLRHTENFADAGIDIEPFGGGTVQIRSMPALLSSRDPRSFVSEIIDELLETQGSRRSKQMAFEVFAQQLAKKAARGDICRMSQVMGLLSSLFECDLPYCTPDGSPTLIHISMKELEKKFSS